MIVSMDTPLFELVEGEGDKEKVTPLFSVMDILESRHLHRQARGGNYAIQRVG